MAAACKAAGVSTSASYARVARRDLGPSEAEQEETDLAREIRTIHDNSGGIYGVPRVTAELRRQGRAVNRKRVERLMRVYGITGWRPCRRRSLTEQDAATPPHPTCSAGR